jgi:predicted nucleic acid-binding Zn ribbon protein
MKTEHCDYCFKPLNKDENYGSIDNLGRGGTFCSPACREKWQKKLNEQDYQDFIR